MILNNNISYFNLILTQYIIDNCPIYIDNKDFIYNKSRDAELKFFNACKAGKTVEDAIDIAKSELFSDLDKHPYCITKSILIDKFLLEPPFPIHDLVIRILDKFEFDEEEDIDAVHSKISVLIDKYISEHGI